MAEDLVYWMSHAPSWQLQVAVTIATLMVIVLVLSMAPEKGKLWLKKLKKKSKRVRSSLTRVVKWNSWGSSTKTPTTME